MKKLRITDFQDIGEFKSIFVNEFKAGIRIFPIPSEYDTQDYYKDTIPFEFYNNFLIVIDLGIGAIFKHTIKIEDKLNRILDLENQLNEYLEHIQDNLTKIMNVEIFNGKFLL